jgi:hypothetical protein
VLNFTPSAWIRYSFTNQESSQKPVKPASAAIH